MSRRHAGPTRRRRALTFVELLFATALLAGALISLLTLLQGGFRGAAHLGDHARAESLSRSVLEFYGRLPLSMIEEARRQGAGADGFAPVGETVRELLGAEDGYELAIGLRRMPGRIPVRALVSRVSWSDLGRTRQVSHKQVLSYLPSAGPGESSAPSYAAAPGFLARRTNPDWGRHPRWELAGYGEEDDGDPPPPGSPAALRRKIARAAKAAVWRPEAYYAGESGQVVHFLGDADAVRDAMRRHPERATQVPWTLRTQSSNQERRRRQFEVRTGVAARDLEGLPAADIPDGVYPFTLEAVDLRDAAGYGKVVGVFLLAGPEGAEYRLVASLTPRDDERTLGVDKVLSRQLVEDERGRVAVLERTEGRLVRIDREGPQGARTLELRTLPAPDPDQPGTAITQRFLSTYRSETRLEPSGQQSEDELLEALVQEYFSDQRQDSAEPARIEPIPQVSTSPCAQGTCPTRPVGARIDLAQRTTLRWRRRGEKVPGADAPAQKALAKLAKGDGKAAIAELDRYLADNPSDLGARALRGRLRASEGDPSGGADDLAEVLRAQPDDVELLRDHAGFLLRAWRLDEAPAAIAAFEKAAPEDPLVDTFRKSLQLAASTPVESRPAVR